MDLEKKSSIEELREKHADILSNKAAKQIAYWGKSNSNKEIDISKLIEETNQTLKDNNYFPSLQHKYKH